MKSLQAMMEVNNSDTWSHKIIYFDILLTDIFYNMESDAADITYL